MFKIFKSTFSKIFLNTFENKIRRRAAKEVVMKTKIKRKIRILRSMLPKISFIIAVEPILVL